MLLKKHNNSSCKVNTLAYVTAAARVPGMDMRQVSGRPSKVGGPSFLGSLVAPLRKTTSAK